MAGFEAAGPSERLRSVAILREMQRKLKEGANVALGVPVGASPAEARSAFLSLTKQYHPAKFARLDEPTVRLANEVFLCLREAYEGLLASPPPTSRRLGTEPGLAEARRARNDVRPPLQRDAQPAPSEPRVAPSEPRALPAPSERLTAGPASLRIGSTRAPRADETPSPVRPPATHLATTRPLVPARASVPPSTARAPLTARPSSVAPPSEGDRPARFSGDRGAASREAAVRTGATRAPEASVRTGATRAPEAAVRTGATRAPEASVRTGATRAPEASVRTGATRAPEAAVRTGATRAPEAAVRTGASTTTSQLQVRFSSRPPPQAAPPTAPAGLFSLLQQGRWAEARALMQERAASEPSERRHLAYLAYVRGCEAASLGQLDDARREFTRALAIEPMLREASAKLAALTGAVRPGSRK